jgi:hypothetical protein
MVQVNFKNKVVQAKSLGNLAEAARDLHGLSVYPCLEFSFEETSKTYGEADLAALRSAVEEAARRGARITFSGLKEHDLLLLWTIVIAAATSGCDTAYRA